MAYRFPHFRRELLYHDFSWEAGPRPGQRFPDFELPTVDGERTGLADLAGRPFLLYFGSIT